MNLMISHAPKIVESIELIDKLKIDHPCMTMDVSCECMHCVAILVEILQPKRYCLLVKTPSRSQHSGGDN